MFSTRTKNVGSEYNLIKLRSILSTPNPLQMKKKDVLILVMRLFYMKEQITTTISNYSSVEQMQIF